MNQKTKRARKAADKAAIRKGPAQRGLQSPMAQLFIGASAAIAGGILAGLWAFRRKR